MSRNPLTGIRGEVIHGIGAIFTASAGGLAAIVFFALFGDEMNENLPPNVGKGILAPVYRHYVDLLVFEWSAVVAVGSGYYALVARMMGREFNWSTFRRIAYRLHFIGGGVAIASVIAAIVTREPMHFREAILTGIGLVLFVAATRERVSLRRSPVQGAFSPNE